jgi:hypothetical protein
MEAMWLDYRAAVVIAAVLAVFGFAVRRPERRWVFATAAARETALILGLYSLWMIAGHLSVMQNTDAVERGRDIWHLERWLHLPSELSLNHWILSYPWLVRLANGYYAIVHVPALVFFLVWLFAFHRDRYGPIRNALAWLTFVSLAIQLVPVAPPRLVPGLGFVDTARLYGQSVYGAVGAPGADQLSAMPSVHVGWALVIGLAAVAVGTSRWRWVILGHPIVTTLVVAATANHWWLDGLAEVGLLAVILAGQRVVRLVAARVRKPSVLPEPDTVDLAPATVST